MLKCNVAQGQDMLCKVEFLPVKALSGQGTKPAGRIWLCVVCDFRNQCLDPWYMESVAASPSHFSNGAQLITSILI